MSKKTANKVPVFSGEADEREFWLTHDSADFVDWSKGKHVTFPNLKPTTQAISLRLPLWMLETIKSTANKQDVPYQSLIKVWLSEKLEDAHHLAKL
jgi:predicted DNA binding CopG/RHH family protein